MERGGKMKRGYLVLENGQAFAGARFGAESDALGELAFTSKPVV